MAKKKSTRVKKGFFGKTASKIKKAATSGVAMTVYETLGVVGSTVAGVLIAGRITNARR